MFGHTTAAKITTKTLQKACCEAIEFIILTKALSLGSLQILKKTTEADRSGNDAVEASARVVVEDTAGSAHRLHAKSFGMQNWPKSCWMCPGQ